MLLLVYYRPRECVCVHNGVRVAGVSESPLHDLVFARVAGGARAVLRESEACYTHAVAGARALCCRVCVRWTALARYSPRRGGEIARCTGRTRVGSDSPFHCGILARCTGQARADVDGPFSCGILARHAGRTRAAVDSPYPCGILARVAVGAHRQPRLPREIGRAHV